MGRCRGCDAAAGTRGDRCHKHQHDVSRYQSGRREMRAPSADASGLPGGVSHLMGGVGGGGAAAAGDIGCCCCCCTLSPLVCGLSTFGRLSSAYTKPMPAGCLPALRAAHRQQLCNARITVLSGWEIRSQQSGGSVAHHTTAAVRQELLVCDRAHLWRWRQRRCRPGTKPSTSARASSSCALC